MRHNMPELHDAASSETMRHNVPEPYDAASSETMQHNVPEPYDAALAILWLILYGVTVGFVCSQDSCR